MANSACAQPLRHGSQSALTHFPSQSECPFFHSALVQFFQLFPEYAKNNFYVTGEVSCCLIFLGTSNITKTGLYDDSYSKRICVCVCVESVHSSNFPVILQIYSVTMFFHPGFIEGSPIGMGAAGYYVPIFCPSLLSFIAMI